MSKKRFSLIISTSLALILALAMIVGAGCAPTAPAPPVKEAIKLIASTYIPPSYLDLVPPMEDYVKYVNEKGQGIVEIEFYSAGTLLKAKEAIPGLRKGSADMIFHTSTYWSGDIPIYNGYSLPFLWKDCFDMQSKLSLGTPLRQLVDEELRKQGYYIVAEGATPVEHLWVAKGVPPIRKPEDLKGLKMRSAGKPESKTLITLGAAPIRMPSAEISEALARGTIDGCMFYMGTVGGRVLYEPLTSVTRATFGGYTVPLIMMEYKWEGLPDDVRAILTEAAKIYEAEFSKRAFKVHQEQYWIEWEKAGNEIIVLSPAEEAAFREALKPVFDWFTEEECPDAGKKFMELATK